MSKTCNFILLAALAVVGIYLSTSPAQGSFQLMVSDNSNSATITDNGSGDTNAGNGVINWDGNSSFTTDGFTILVTTGSSKPNFPNSTTVAFQDLSITVSYSGSGNQNLTVDLTDTDFNLNGLSAGPASILLKGSNNNTGAVTGGSYTSYINYGLASDGSQNGQFAGVPGGGDTSPAYGSLYTSGTLTPPNGLGTQSLSGSASLSNNFTLSDQVVFSFTGGASISFDGNTTVTVAPAPQGFLLALSSVPVLGLGCWLRRRQVHCQAVA